MSQGSAGLESKQGKESACTEVQKRASTALEGSHRIFVHINHWGDACRREHDGCLRVTGRMRSGACIDSMGGNGNIGGWWTQVGGGQEKAAAYG